MPGQRIGLMGGSFNPPHSGHLAVARTALRRLGLDQLWWVVTPGNPLKSSSGLPSQDERMALCRRFTGSDPRMKVTGFEADLGTPYTAATVASLRKSHPGVRFVWVMGADNLATFDRWQHWRSILETVPVAVIDRPGFHLKAQASRAARAFGLARVPAGKSKGLARMAPPAWVFLTMRLSGDSSTAIRGGRPAKTL